MSEVETNTTLAIRLKRDFGYDPPPFDHEDTPESYLAKVERSIELNPNWRVHRFVTIGNFGFSKLAMYTDLDPELWSADGGFGDHVLIRNLLLGQNRSDADPFEAPDYDIDSKEIDAQGLLLVTDADASQHSALVLGDKSISYMLGCGHYESYSDQLIEIGSSDSRILGTDGNDGAPDGDARQNRAGGLRRQNDPGNSPVVGHAYGYREQVAQPLCTGRASGASRPATIRPARQIRSASRAAYFGQAG